MFSRLKIVSISVFIIFILASSGCSYAKDDAPRLRTTVDRKTILIGDRIRYTIEASYGESLDVPMPSFKDDKIGDFEIKDSGRRTKQGFFGMRSVSNWYSITIYSVGRQTIPEVEVKYRKAGAKDWASLKTAAINITVQSVIAKGSAPGDIRDVKGPFGYFEINWWLVSGLAVFLTVLLVVILKITRRPVPERLPHETALEELEAAKGDYAKTGDVKEFYVGASDCVRRYIERVFKLKAPEMTTEEFLNSLKDAGALTQEEKSLLREFLNACDLVKFAKYAPTKPEMESIYQTAKSFIEETKKIYMQENPKR